MPQVVGDVGSIAGLYQEVLSLRVWGARYNVTKGVWFVTGGVLRGWI